MSSQKILETYAPLGVELLKSKLQPLSATGKTVQSVRAEVSLDRLVIFARDFVGTIETGRGPRKSSTPGGFEDSMLEYMKARGIGADLTDKKRKQLARFLTYKINKEGDKTFKSGGRQVYSDALAKFVEELKQALIDDFKKTFINSLKLSFKTKT